MPDYAQDARDARATLEEDGQMCRVRVFTDVDYNESEGEVIRTHVDTPVPGAMFDFFFGETSKSGEEVKKGDKRLLLASDVEINDENKGNVEILASSHWYTVVGVREENPAGICIMYDLHLRK